MFPNNDKCIYLLCVRLENVPYNTAHSEVIQNLKLPFIILVLLLA